MFIVTSLIVLITLLNIIFYYLRQYHEEEQGYGYPHNSSSSSSSLSGLQCRRFLVKEIISATQNFNEELVIGEGGFGKVYRGIIDDGATTVAIKRLGYSSKQGASEFWTEIEMLSKFRHSHLVSLIGYCNDQPEMIIVYEYMPGGTLADNLHKSGRSNRPLSWEQRLKICLAKVSDFGLSKIGPAEQLSTHVSTHVKGTFGYLDPEYFLTRRLTRKSDVYAFGVVMFEALCGRAAVDVRLDEEQWSLAKWAKRCIKERRLQEIVDPHLRGCILADCLEAFARTADQCLHSSSRKRPTMAEVITRLEYALSLQEATNFSLMDAEIISNGSDYDNQEGADASTEAEPSDAGGSNFSDAENIGLNEEHAARRRKSPILPAKNMKFVKKLGSFFSIKVRVVTDDEYPDLRLGQLKRFSLPEILVATNNFGSDNILSSGGFDKVYRGCLANGSLVAIKTHDKRHFYGGKRQFQKEVETIGRAVHQNLLQLQGFCVTSTERLLVYPYMANGSVASSLREQCEGKSSLDWGTRKRIALGSARGLTYLHDDCIPGIIHRKIKASNIFLNDALEVVIGNFGVGQCMYESDVLIYPCIIGVTPPKYLSTGKFSPKTDVYAYGVMLLELITGRRPFSLAERADADNVWIFDWVKRFVVERKLETLVDTGLQGNYIYEEVEQLTQVALLCTQDSSMKRPRMSEVAQMLQGDGIAERWVEWQKGQSFSNTSHSDTSWIVDSVEDIPSEELLSPR